MSGHDPQPGELWETDEYLCVEKRADGWYRHLPDGYRHLPDVERLRSAGYDALGWQRRCERAEADRDAAVAAVKCAEDDRAQIDAWFEALNAFREVDAAFRRYIKEKAR